MKIEKKKICSVCKENIATIQILDSMVCDDCLPKEYSHTPMSISSDKIKFMLHNDPGCEQKSEKEIDDIRVVPNHLKSKFLPHDSEYTLSDEINTQMKTAEGVDIAVSFIYASGLAMIYDSLYETSKKFPIRIITTAYTGSTEPEALHDLITLKNCNLKMELDVGTRRLHMKNYIFYRSDGNSTALISSANLSRIGLTTGAESAIRISEADLPEMFSDIKSNFDRLWKTPKFRPISIKNRSEIEDALYNNKADYGEY